MPQFGSIILMLMLPSSLFVYAGDLKDLNQSVDEGYTLSRVKKIEKARDQYISECAEKKISDASCESLKQQIQELENAVQASALSEPLKSNVQNDKSLIFGYKKVRLRKFYFYKACVQKISHNTDTTEQAFASLNSIDSEKKKCLKHSNLLVDDYKAEMRFQSKKRNESLGEKNAQFKKFYECLDEINIERDQMNPREPIDRFYSSCLKKSDLKNLKEILGDER